MMENLNKISFWDSLHKTYPDAVNRFIEWLNEYKKEVSWEVLFLNCAKTDFERKEIKFHDIPIEMQFGILIRFNQEVCKDACQLNYSKSMDLQVTQIFSNLNITESIVAKF